MRRLLMLRGFALVTLLVAPTVSAQDLGSLFRGVINNRAAGIMDMVIKSATDVTFGELLAGEEGPQDAEGKVVLYRTEWCGYCKQAAAYMQQKNMPFVERDIERNPAYKAEYRRLGGTGPVPFTVFGTRTLSGFSPSSFDNYYNEFQRAQNAVVSPSAQAKGPANADGAVEAGATLTGKIPGIPIYAAADKSAPRLVALGKDDAVVYMGEEKNGFYRVTSAAGEGWVDKLLVKQQ